MTCRPPGRARCTHSREAARHSRAGGMTPRLRARAKRGIGRAIRLGASAPDLSTCSRPRGATASRDGATCCAKGVPVAPCAARTRSLASRGGGVMRESAVLAVGAGAVLLPLPACACGCGVAPPPPKCGNWFHSMRHEHAAESPTHGSVGCVRATQPSHAACHTKAISVIFVGDY